MLKIEPVEAAVQRTIATMMEWGDENKAEFNHYFLYVNLNRAVHHIKNGKISCWVMLNCKGGTDMLAKFSDEQLEMIAPAFDLTFWLRKFKEQKEDTAMVKEICRETNIL
jgi:uroporphyrinogen-III decarboxylase